MASDRNCTWMLGIDLGTSSVKAMLVADDATEVRTASVNCTVHYPQPGQSEADVEAWWQAVVQAVSLLEVRGCAVRGIGISVLYPALILFDEQMKPIRPAILYNDQRAVAESEELIRRYGESGARALTGNAFPVGTAAITSLLWLRNHEPHTFASAARIGTANTLLVHRLTGEFTIDHSNAALSGLYDTARNRWSDDLCGIAGVSPQMLPHVLSAQSAAGYLSVQAASTLGLTAGIPVAAGAGDTACAALGIGVIEESEIFASCGSTNCFAGLASSPSFDNSLVNTSYLDDATWINIGSTNASGAAINWFIKTWLDGADFEEFSRLAASSKPGAGGVIFLPYLAGERTPLYDPRARAVFFGLTSSTTLADTARAVAEGICFADRHIIETFEQGNRRVHSILAAGGGNRSGLIRTIRADITGRALQSSSTDNIAAYGAALLGGIASGLYATWREAAAAARRVSKFTVTTPASNSIRLYDGQYQKYRQLYIRIKDLFE